MLYLWYVQQQNPFLIIESKRRVENDGRQQDVEEEGGGELGEGVLRLTQRKQ